MKKYKFDADNHVKTAFVTVRRGERERESGSGGGGMKLKEDRIFGSRLWGLSTRYSPNYFYSNEPLSSASSTAWFNSTGRHILPHNSD